MASLKSEKSTKLPDQVLALEASLKSSIPKKGIAEVRQAYLLGEQAHRGQTRNSGEAYIFHPIAVAQILADKGLDKETIIAAILHDTIEDTDLDKDDINEQFGDAVADLVDGVTKLDKFRFASRMEASAESFRKMMLAMSRDIRVILIKLADRLHNMRTLDAMPPEKKRRIATETLQIYAPIAHRLGMDSIRRELQDLSFKAKHPMRYRIIRGLVEQAQGRNKERLISIGKALRTRLKSERIKCTIDGRAKSPYSVYRKMKTKTLAFRDILDLLGFRVIVNSVSQCYMALGVVHNLYKPRPGRFKDYIALPKSNGYQSLHTGLFGPYGDPIEIQIRTRDMDVVAEQGIAAHWTYKVNQNDGGNTATRASEWLRRLLDIQTQAGNSQEFLESVKVELFPDEVYVFTPRGKIIRLPRNASVLDFAYAVHTDVGNHAVHAWVDKNLAPLRQRLNNGETVDIITANSAEPRPTWLDYVVTGKARTAIRHHLKQLKHEEAVQVGHRMLDRALVARSSSLDVITDSVIKDYLQELKFSRLEELLTDIALGNRMPSLVARHLLNKSVDEDIVEPGEALLLTGDEGHVVSYAKCCHPIPGDKIVGYLTAGKGIVVHRVSCHNLKELRKNPDRKITVAWDDDDHNTFSVEMRVEVHNQPGVLAQVASIISETGTNIEHVENIERDGKTSMLVITIAVTNRLHLARVMRRLRNKPVVISVHRSRG